MNQSWTRVVVGIVFNEKGEVLLSSRPQGKAYAGYWEFAGGKVEQGESDFDALKREWQEELGIHIHHAQFWQEKHHQYEHAQVVLRLFLVAFGDWSGTVCSQEGQEWCWQNVQDFTVSPMLPANTVLLQELAALPVPKSILS